MSMICPSSATPAPAGIAQFTGISSRTGARGCARCWRLTVTLGKPMRTARVPSSVTSTGSEAGNSMYIPPNAATRVTCWHSSSAVVDVHQRLRLDLAVRLGNAVGHSRGEGRSRVADVDLAAGDVVLPAVERARPGEARHRVLGGSVGRRVRTRRVRGDRAVVDDAP